MNPGDTWCGDDVPWAFPAERASYVAPSRSRPAGRKGERLVCRFEGETEDEVDSNHHHVGFVHGRTRLAARPRLGLFGNQRGRVCAHGVSQPHLRLLAIVYPHI